MADTNKKKKYNQRVVSLLTLVVVFVFLVYFCVTFIIQEIRIHDLNSEADQITEQINQESENSKQLKEEMKEENQLKRAEEEARELGYLKNDEILFVDSSEK